MLLIFVLIYFPPEAQIMQKEMHNKSSIPPKLEELHQKKKDAIQENFLMNDVSMAFGLKQDH